MHALIFIWPIKGWRHISLTFLASKISSHFWLMSHMTCFCNYEKFNYKCHLWLKINHKDQYKIPTFFSSGLVWLNFEIFLAFELNSQVHFFQLPSLCTLQSLLLHVDYFRDNVYENLCRGVLLRNFQTTNNNVEFIFVN